MRNLFLLAFILVSQMASAQKTAPVMPAVPMADGHVVYDREFSAPGKSAAQLFERSEQWFAKRYRSAEQVDVKDRATEMVADTGTEILTFKGPLNRDVTCKLKMRIEILSKAESYRVRITDIVYGYQASTDEERTYFSAEDLLNNINQRKYRNTQGINPVPFNKKQSAKALASLNPVVENVITSIKETLGGR